jgi:hypothetical protein
MRGNWVTERRSVEYQDTPFERLFMQDFSGGVNETDPAISLQDNQFKQLTNMRLNRQGRLETRPPYRPYNFGQGSVTDYGTTTINDGAADRTISKVIDYKVFKSDSSSYAIDGSVHVLIVKYTNTETYIGIMAYKGSTNAWVTVDSGIADGTSVFVELFSVNQAHDLLVFRGDATPKRFTLANDTLSSLGMTAPNPSALFSESEGDITLSADITTDIYYKFSYFFDDNNVSTKYGEGDISDKYTHSYESTSSVDEEKSITINLTGVATGGVSKIYVYRAPKNTPDGPYRYIGYADISSSSVSFTDDTPWDTEGQIASVSGSNPATESLRVINPSVVSGVVFGFDKNMPYKLLWCDAGYPDRWNPLNFDYLEGNGQIAVGFNRKVYIFTDISCYEKENASSPAYKISNVGVKDRRTVYEVGRGLIWCGNDSVYFADYVQQYGSKGDFPRDIGHPISVSVKNIDSDYIVDACFFEQRYYLSITTTLEASRILYVYDVDFGCWTRYSITHDCFQPNQSTLFSAGEDSDGKVYVYEHDYLDYTTDGTESLRDTKDYTNVESSAYANSSDIAITLEKELVHLAGEYRWSMISSMSLLMEGQQISASASFVWDANTITLNFSDAGTDISGHSTDYVFKWGDGSGNGSLSPDSDYATEYASDPDSVLATATEYGFAGTPKLYANMHKKVRRRVKSDKLDITITVSQSKESSILGVGLYYKPLPQRA